MRAHRRFVSPSVLLFILSLLITPWGHAQPRRVTKRSDLEANLGKLGSILVRHAHFTARTPKVALYTLPPVEKNRQWIRLFLTYNGRFTKRPYYCHAELTLDVSNPKKVQIVVGEIHVHNNRIPPNVKLVKKWKDIENSKPTALNALFDLVSHYPFPTNNKLSQDYVYSNAKDGFFPTCSPGIG